MATQHRFPINPRSEGYYSDSYQRLPKTGTIAQGIKASYFIGLPERRKALEESTGSLVVSPVTYTSHPIPHVSALPTIHRAFPVITLPPSKLDRSTGISEGADNDHWTLVRHGKKSYGGMEFMLCACLIQLYSHSFAFPAMPAADDGRHTEARKKTPPHPYPTPWQLLS